MPIPGKLELTLKIIDMPPDVQDIENGWKQFVVDCEGRLLTVRLRPRLYKRLEEAPQKWPNWLAAITGRMGPNLEDGSALLTEANVVIFEHKSKAARGASPPQEPGAVPAAEAG